MLLLLRVLWHPILHSATQATTKNIPFLGLLDMPTWSASITMSKRACSNRTQCFFLRIGFPCHTSPNSVGIYNHPRLSSSSITSNAKYYTEETAPRAWLEAPGLHAIVIRSIATNGANNTCLLNIRAILHQFALAEPTRLSVAPLSRH